MSEVPFTKDNLDGYLKELSKEFRKMNGSRMPAEIILIGGAAVLINYGFREMTYDMDAIIQASSSMKDAINHVGDRMGLPNGWLNTDFMKTACSGRKAGLYRDQVDFTICPKHGGHLELCPPASAAESAGWCLL